MSRKKHITIATRNSPLALWQADHVRTRLLAAHPELRITLLPLVTEGDRLTAGASRGDSDSRTLPANASPVARAPRRGGRETSEEGMANDSLAAGAPRRDSGKALFVKGLEDCLLDGRADMAVHSVKDVAGQLPEGLGLSAILAREQSADVLVWRRDCDFSSPSALAGLPEDVRTLGPDSPRPATPASSAPNGLPEDVGMDTAIAAGAASGGGATLEGLPKGARIGTSSLRRQGQLLAARPDLCMIDVHGNVGSRLQRLDAGEYDAIVLAEAGLRRLGEDQRISLILSEDLCLPAPGQGAIGVECRLNDAAILDCLRPLHDSTSAACVLAERAFSRTLGGACRLPIGALGQVDSAQLRLRGRVVSPNGERLVQGHESGPLSDAEAIGSRLASRLLAAGAEDILREVQQE